MCSWRRTAWRSASSGCCDVKLWFKGNPSREYLNTQLYECRASVTGYWRKGKFFRHPRYLKRLRVTVDATGTVTVYGALPETREVSLMFGFKSIEEAM